MGSRLIFLDLKESNGSCLNATCFNNSFFKLKVIRIHLGIWSVFFRCFGQSIRF